MGSAAAIAGFAHHPSGGVIAGAGETGRLITFAPCPAASFGATARKVEIMAATATTLPSPIATAALMASTVRVPDQTLAAIPGVRWLAAAASTRSRFVPADLRSL
jgi:hypothetical protein